MQRETRLKHQTQCTSFNIFQHCKASHSKPKHSLPEDTVSPCTYFQGEDAGDAGDEVVDTAPPGLCWVKKSIKLMWVAIFAESSLQENPSSLQLDLQLGPQILLPGKTYGESVTEVTWFETRRTKKKTDGGCWFDSCS